MEPESVFEFGSQFFTDGLIIFAGTAVVSLIIAWLISASIGKAMHKTTVLHGNKIFADYLTKIITVIIYAIAIVSILNRIKPLKGIGAAVLGATGVFTIVIGLAAQESFGNFIAGFFLALFQPFKKGDIVVLPDNGIAGTVTEINFRHTVITTKENTRIIVPNSTMNTAIIEDRWHGQEFYKQFVVFSVGYDTDIDKMKKAIYEEAAKIEEIVDTRTPEQIAAGEPPFTIRIDDYLDSGIAVNFPVATRVFAESYPTCSKLRIALLKRFADEGIEIPYTKIDIVK